MCLLSPDSCEQTDSKKEKAYRKLTFKKKQEVGKEKERRKAKRTASVNGPSGYSIANYRQQRSLGGTISPPNKLRQKAHDSSEESSIASGMGSIPFDLPGSVDDADLQRRHYPDNSLTLEDVSISLGQPEMVDVAVQCSPMCTRYNSPSSHSSSTPAGGAKGEHSNRLHAVNLLSIHTSPTRTQSLPTTPIKKQKSLIVSDMFNCRGGTGGRAAMGEAAASRRLYINQALSNGRSRDLHEPVRRRKSADQLLTEVREMIRSRYS